MGKNGKPKNASSAPSVAANKREKTLGIVVTRDGLSFVETLHRKKRTVFVDQNALKGAVDGDVVLLRRADNKGKMKITRVLGKYDTAATLTLISLVEKGLRESFSDAVTKHAEGLTVPTLEGREDLRQIPLVTIDGPDSRDFDDAVYAKPRADGGFDLIVAIADVSWYVRPGSRLDEEAYARGNSTYFPDRALPMLPEALSNDLCSLRPHEDRACMAFHISIDKDGQMTGYKVTRALMRSAARLTYGQVQQAKDGKPDAVTLPLMQDVINPLYAAFAALRRAREARGAVEMDSQEYRFQIGTAGRVAAISKYVRYESCKVIEEFMILANVAAATALESRNAPCVYRIHHPPQSGDRLKNLNDILGKLGIISSEKDLMTREGLNAAIKKVQGTPAEATVTKAVMQAQSKAVYDAGNVGHFGLALQRYAHFTSPIRRYADLLVHRSLVEAFNLGAGGITPDEKNNLPAMAQHISDRETDSAQAERAARDRFAVAAMQKRVNEEFSGRIISVMQAGVLVILPDQGGVVGFLPVSQLPGGKYRFDEKSRELKGKTASFAQGQSVNVVIKQVDAPRSDIVFSWPHKGQAVTPQAQSGHRI